MASEVSATVALPAGDPGRRRALVAVAAGLAGAVWSCGVPAQDARPADAAGPAPARPAAPGWPVDLVRTGLYLISGGGGNTLMRLSAVGIVLVDSKAPGQYRPLRSQIARINRLGDLPLRVLFLTDLQPQHAGNVDAVRAAGVAVIAPRRAAAALSPSGAASSPGSVVPFDGDYRLQLGGVTVRALHVGPARTADSTLVHFVDLKVLAVGDLLSPAGPVPDHAVGGSLSGWLAALDQALALDADLVVPADGAPVDRGQLLAYRDRLDVWLRRGRALLADGVDGDRFSAGMRAAETGWPLDLTPVQWQSLRTELATRP